jgi:hypothetical protein
MKRLTWLLLFLPAGCYAQVYTAEAPLAKVKESGFYSIILPTNITSLLNADLGNVRILDSTDTEVPYLPTFEKPETNKFVWSPMEIEKEIRKNCCTMVTIRNDQKEYVDNFLVTFKNTDVLKVATIRGSDDGDIWYAVHDKFVMQGINNSKEEISNEVEIPISNYKYYQLTIDDSASAPFNIVRVERTREDIVHGAYNEIPDVTITSHDSLQNRETWGIIEFDTAQYVDRIEFDVFGPHLYKRNATLLRKVGNRFDPITTFDIISGQGRPVYVELKEKTLYIRVNNDNNPPLKFTQVAAYQVKRVLIAYLEPGDYKIALGEDLERPVYDIDFHKDGIPAHLDNLEIGSLKKMAIRRTPKSTTYFTNRNIIWVAIFLVAGLLLVMTVRMLKDVRKQ